MKDVLAGFKTKITGYIPAVVAVVALFGIDLDPEQIASFIDQFEAWVVAGAGLYGVLVHWFRNLAK